MFPHYHGRLVYKEQRGGRGGEANRRQNYDEWNMWSQYSSWKTEHTGPDFSKWDTEHSNNGNLKYRLPSFGYGSADSVTGRSEHVSYGVNHTDCFSYSDTYHELQQPRAKDGKESEHSKDAIDLSDNNGYKLERDSLNILDQTTSQNQMYHNENLDQQLLCGKRTGKNEKRENLKDSEFWIPSRTQVQEPRYHFNVIYNYAQCPLSRTDDTDLATKITRTLVEKLELKGYGNSYYHDRDHRPYNSLTKELGRVVAGSSVTILLLTPGFLRNCLEHYLDISVFRNLLFNLPAQKRLIALGVGVTRDQIPSQLQHCDILYFNKDWEVDMATWDRFESVIKDELGLQFLTKWQSRTCETKEWNAKPELDIYEKRMDTDSTLFEKATDTSFRLFEERTATRSAWLEEHKDTSSELFDKKRDPNTESEEKTNLSESDMWWAGQRSEELNSQQSSHFMDNPGFEHTDLHNLGLCGHKFRALLGRQVDQISSKTFDDFIPPEHAKAKHLNSGLGEESEGIMDDIENFTSFSECDPHSPDLNGDDLDMELLTIKYGSVWDGNETAPKEIRDHCDVWEAANHEIWDKAGQEWTKTFDCGYGTVKYGKQHQQLFNGRSLDSFHSYHANTEEVGSGKLYLPDGWTIDEEQESWIMDAISNWSSYDIRDYWALSHMYHWWVPEETIKRNEISEMPDLGTEASTKGDHLNNRMISRVEDAKSKNRQISEWEEHKMPDFRSVTSRGENREKEERKASEKQHRLSTETKACNSECSLNGKTNLQLSDYKSDHNLLSANTNIIKDEHLHSATDLIFQHLSSVKTNHTLESHSHTLHLSGNEAHSLPSYETQNTSYHFGQPHVTKTKESYDIGTSCDNASDSLQSSALRKCQDRVVETYENNVTDGPRNINAEGSQSRNVNTTSNADTDLIDQHFGENKNNDKFSLRHESEGGSRSLSPSAKEIQPGKIRDVGNTILTGKLPSVQPTTLEESETKSLNNFDNNEADSEKILSKFSSPTNNNVSSEPSPRSNHIATLTSNLPHTETVDGNEQTLFQGTDKTVKLLEDNSEVNTKVTDVTSKCKIIGNPKIKLVTSTTQSSMQIKISVPSIADNIKTTVTLDTSSQSHRIEKKDKDAINFRLGEGENHLYPGDIHDKGETDQVQNEVSGGEKNQATDNNCDNVNVRSALPDNNYDSDGKSDLQNSPYNCNFSEKRAILSQYHISVEQETDNITKTEYVLNRVEMGGASRADGAKNTEHVRLSSNISADVGSSDKDSLSQDSQTEERTFQSGEDVSGSYSVLENLNRNIVANFLSEDILLANLNTEMNSKYSINKDSDKRIKSCSADYTEVNVAQDLSSDKWTMPANKDTTIADENQIPSSTTLSTTADLVIVTESEKDIKTAIDVCENESPDQAGVTKSERFRTESTSTVNICNEDALISHENIAEKRQKENCDPEINTLSKEDPAKLNQHQHSNDIKVEDLSPGKQATDDNKDFIITNGSQTHSYPETDLTNDIKDETLPVADNKDEVVSGDNKNPICIKDSNVETQLVIDSKGKDTHWNQTHDCNTENEMQVVTGNQGAVLTNKDHDIGNTSMKHSVAETPAASNKVEVILGMNQTSNNTYSKQSSQVETIKDEKLSASGTNEVVMMYEGHNKNCQPEELNVETNKGIESMAVVEEINFSFSSEEFLEEGTEDNETETELSDTVGCNVETYHETKTHCQHVGNENGANNFSDDEKNDQHTNIIYDNGQISLARDYSRNDEKVISLDEKNLSDGKTQHPKNVSAGENNEEQNVSGYDEKEEYCITVKVEDEKQNILDGWGNGEYSLSPSDCTRHEENIQVLAEKNEQSRVDEIPEEKTVSSEQMELYKGEAESVDFENKNVEREILSNEKKEENYQLALEEMNDSDMLAPDMYYEEDSIFSAFKEHEDLNPSTEKERQRLPTEKEGEEENQTTEEKPEEHAFKTDEVDGNLNFRNNENRGHKVSSGELEIETQTADVKKSLFAENRQTSPTGDDKPDLENSTSEKESTEKDNSSNEKTLDKNNQLGLNMSNSSSIQRQGETSSTPSKENLEHSTGHLRQPISYLDDLGSSVDFEVPPCALTKMGESGLSQTSFCANDTVCEIDDTEEKDDPSVKVLIRENEKLSCEDVANESSELGTENGIKETDTHAMNKISNATDETWKENIITKINLSSESNILCVKHDQPSEESNKSSNEKEETGLEACYPCDSTKDPPSPHSYDLYKLFTENEKSSFQSKFPKDELNIIAYQIADDMLKDQMRPETTQQPNRKQRDVSHDINNYDSCDSKLEEQTVENEDTHQETTELTHKDMLITVDNVDGADSLSYASWRSEATGFKDLGLDEEVGVVDNERPDNEGMLTLHSVLHTETETVESVSPCDDNEKKFRAAHGTSVDQEDLSRIHAMFCAPDDVSFESYNSPRSNQFIEGDSGYFGEKSDSFIGSEDFTEEMMQRGITMNSRNSVTRKNELGENNKTVQTSNVDNYDLRSGNVSGITSVLKNIESPCLIYNNENVFVSDFDEDRYKYLEHTLADTRLDNSRVQTKEKDTELWGVVEKGDKEPFLLPGDSGINKEKRSSFYDESSTFRHNISREVSIYGEGLQRFGRQSKATLYRPWINESIWQIGRRTFQRGSPTTLGWNFNAKLTDTPYTTAGTHLEPDSTESFQAEKDRLPSGEILNDKEGSERLLMGKEAPPTEDVKTTKAEAMGGGSAESKTKGDWWLQLYKGMCHAISKPDMPYMG